MPKDDTETFDNNRRQLGGLPVVRRNVAGVDLGSQRHWVCAPTRDGSGREIASFGATTSELMRLAEWLKARQVESVAMESTGIYWIAPPEVLEGQGLQVLLVDTRQLARVPGRDKKTIRPSAIEHYLVVVVLPVLKVHTNLHSRFRCETVSKPFVSPFTC